jgi:hypothetical protein
MFGCRQSPRALGRRIAYVRMDLTSPPLRDGDRAATAGCEVSAVARATGPPCPVVCTGYAFRCTSLSWGATQRAAYSDYTRDERGLP